MTEVAQEKSWNCSQCTYENSGLLFICQLCSRPRHEPRAPQKPLMPIPIVKRQESGHIECSVCTLKNLLTATHCVICSKPLYSGLAELEAEPKHKALVICIHCHLENHESNEVCPGCDKHPLKHVEVSEILPDEFLDEQLEVKECKICKSALSTVNYARHVRECQESLALISKFGSHQVLPHSGTQSCPFCAEHIETEIFKKHLNECKQKAVFEDKAYSRLTPLQKTALQFMNQNSQKQHFSAKAALVGRFKKLGYDLLTLEAVAHYIENYAPIIVHIHVSKHMEFFVKDTHYRNQFETGKSSGSLSRDSRTSWEKRMFFGRYDHAKDFQRVKYGTINFTNDPKGVSSCRGYGNSYFLLKSHVRDRCTVTDQDSSSANSLIGTFKFCYHVLNRLTDAELKAAVQAAKAQEVSSAVVGTYKQIQIHGPLEFAKDIQRIYVNAMEIKDKKYMALVEQFSHRFGVDYQIFKA